MRAGTTAGGETWSVRRRVLAWHPAAGHRGFGVESVHWIDQTRPGSDSARGTGAAAEPAKPKLLLSGLVYLISGPAALVATPFIFIARVLGLARWCVDVRIDGVLVDMRFARGRAGADRLIDDAADQLQRHRFRTELESALPVLAFPDYDIGPDDLAG